MWIRDLFENELLTEIDWYDKSPLIPVLKKYRDKWIHFSRGIPNRTGVSPYKISAASKDEQDQYKKDGYYNVPKIGLNAAMGLTGDARNELGFRASHDDPPGIYFYPVNYLLTGTTHRLGAGSQYGTDMPYYFIADIDLSSNGINLGNVSWEQVENIARHNGWFEHYKDFMSNIDELKKTSYFARREEVRKPGWFLWNFIDEIVQDGLTTWSKAFRGIDYIYDPNLSIIHSNEPHQLVVLNPRIYKVIDSGSNRSYRDSEADKPGHWDYAVKSIFKSLRGEYGGTITWKNKKPTITFTVGQASFTVKFNDRGWNSPGLTIDYTQGRAVGHFMIKPEQFRDFGIEQIVSEIDKKVRIISRRKTDLMFKPAMSEKAMLDLFKQTTSEPLLLKTEIHNDGRVGNSGEITIIGTAEKNVDDISLGIRVWNTVSTSTFRLGASIGLLNQNFMQVSLPGYDGNPPDEVDEVLDQLALKFKEDLNNRVDFYRPKEDRTYWKTFQDDKMANAFLGWMAKNSGLSFGGRIEKLMADEISIFEAYPYKGAMFSDIRYMFRN